MEFKQNLLFDKCKMVLKEAESLGASQAEVAVGLRRTALTRLANSIIDQNVAENHASLRVLVYYGKQRGSVNVEVFDETAIKDAVRSAAKIAKVSPEIDGFVSLPSPKPYSKALDGEKLIPEATLNVTPEQRAECALAAINTAEDVDKRVNNIAGALSVAVGEVALVNSLGIEAYRVGATCKFTATIMAADGTEETAGWAQDKRRDFASLRVHEVAEKAAQKASDGFGKKLLSPGDYEIVMEPAAAGGLFLFMAIFGFSAQMYQDYVSFLRDRIGEKLFSEKLSFWDDSTDLRFPAPKVFDEEGYPKSRLNLIKDGVVKNLTYDTLTASRDGVESTGHNVKGRGRSLPFADNGIVKEGDSSVEEMISETKNGILVTHFHYQNPIDPTKAIYTGLTRDGAWYIKSGVIQYPLKTLRYTDSLLRFFAEIDLIGRYEDLYSSDYIVPPLKLPKFKITGSSETS